MRLFVSLFIEGGIAVAIIILLWTILINARKNNTTNVLDASSVNEDLEIYAAKMARNHDISKIKGHVIWPVSRMNNNYQYILSCYKIFNEDIKKRHAIVGAAEWLLDNFYLIEEQVKGIRIDFNKKSYLSLPLLKSGQLKGHSRIFALAMELLAYTNGQIDESIISNYFIAYQRNSILLDREIWLIPTVLKLAIVEKIRQICEKIIETQIQWHKADRIIDNWLDIKDEEQLDKLFVEIKKILQDLNPSFIEHLMYRLRRSGKDYTKIVEYIDEILENHDTKIQNITQKEHDLQAENTVIMGNLIISLKFVSSLDWTELFEDLSQIEQVLKQDPLGIYSRMDAPSRNYYRNRIQEIASTFGFSEMYVAKKALSLAKEEFEKADSLQFDKHCKKYHLGYYLVDKGAKHFEHGQNIIKKSRIHALNFVKNYPVNLYIGFITLITVILSAIAMQYVYYTAYRANLFFSIFVGLIVLIPSSEIAIQTINLIVCKGIKPTIFPRFEFKQGIPEDMKTIVVVPSLLTDETRIDELIKNLESHYLSNREDNLFFALLGAFKDADEPLIPDAELMITKAINEIKQLNEKYSNGQNDIFYFFHRQSVFNHKENKWIGWERKRGALLEFNEMLLGKKPASIFYYSNKSLPDLHIKYVITLDSDTILPLGMAKKMIGTMAHPLNRPLIDKKRGVVTEGYGIMQPLVDFDIESSNKSMFSCIFAGQEGLDPYSSATSDVYQDLFGEGIFTGKGIYDLEVFQEVLRDTIPENTILSHDLLEGCYVRTALVTDLKLIDSYPSRYNSFAARLHRWVRGDWQLLPWLKRKVLNSKGQKVLNPLSFMCKWKIFDNIRRSLVNPMLIILGVLGIGIFPVSSVFLLSFLIIVLAVPFVTTIISNVLSLKFRIGKIKRHLPVISGIKATLLQTLLLIIFLPYQAYLMMNAIFVTLVRVVVTKKKLLEWVTFADVEKTQVNSLLNYFLKMSAAPLVGVITVFLTFNFKPENLIISIILFIVWSISPIVAYLISKEHKQDSVAISKHNQKDLTTKSRKTWRYFEEFSNTKTNYLIPDNYQENPPRGLAYRTSPTNIGLGLLANLAARDMGYIGTSEMISLISNTLNTVEKMDKWNGHLYNWYNIKTLKPLKPRYVSTVDSGNLVCYLITLKEGIKDCLNKPLVDLSFISGIRDTLDIAGNEGLMLYKEVRTMNDTEEIVDLIAWNKILDKLSDCKNIHNLIWRTKLQNMVKMFKKEALEFMPWIDVLQNRPKVINFSNHEIVKEIQDIYEVLMKNSALSDLSSIYINIIERINNLIIKTKKYKEDVRIIVAWLCELLRSVEESLQETEKFIKECRNIIKRIENLAESMKFALLYVEKKQVFSIGYNIEEGKLTNSYYDLLASEARQTSYIAVARGEVAHIHWFKLGRALTVLDGYKGLVSWTGTMFEYLMPLLIMKNYKNTLLDETYSFVIRSQKKYGKQRKIPWGVSESGFSAFDINLDYQYKAIGVPWLGLKRGLIEDAVVSPYSTILALMVDPKSVVENIKYLKDEGMYGPYGFYEAADYTPERLKFDSKRAIVKNFMAHHQGMSLLAFDNYFNNNIMQTRFHSDPQVNSARLLLQEKIPTDIVLTKETKDKVIKLKEIIYKDGGAVRKFYMPDTMLPKTHILSNGNYSVMVTDRGTGYSKNNVGFITRWREDISLDNYGMLFYIRNVNTDDVWSATYAPFNILPDKYQVTFTSDKAMFVRENGDITTRTEIMVTSGDNAEIRKISIKNNGKLDTTVEITGYFELVLAPWAQDLSHQVFSNLFVQTEFYPEKMCIVANRRPRSESDNMLWLAHTVVVDGETVGDIQFDTDRMKFIGRGRDVRNPLIIQQNKDLSGTKGAVLDPIISLRVKIKVEAGKTVSASFISIAGESNEAMFENLEKYKTVEAINTAFWLASTRSQVELRYLNIAASDVELYQDLISHLIFLSPSRRKFSEFITKNTNGHSKLWSYGISGDLPIVLVVFKKEEQISMLYEILKAYEYWGLKNLKVDLVILCKEEYTYENPLHQLISDVIESRGMHVLNTTGGIFILNKNKMPNQDVILFYAAARIILKCDEESFSKYQAKNILVDGEEYYLNSNQMMFYKKDTGSFNTIKTEETTDFKQEEYLYFNGIGGFNKEGNEYTICLKEGENTPMPWTNIISNSKFGFLVTESGSGYTWYGNSRENKLSPWSNDPVSDKPGEVFYLYDLDNRETWTITPLPIREDKEYIIKHGFGYSVFQHNSHEIQQCLTQYVPVGKNVKVSIINLRNLSDKSRNLTLTYYIRPVLGVTDQFTAMHIKTSMLEDKTLLIENKYNEEFGNVICFVDTSIKDRIVTGDRKEFFGMGGLYDPDGLKHGKLSGNVGTGYDPCSVMQVKIELFPMKDENIVFVFGAAENIDEIKEITQYYQNYDNAKGCLEKVREFWNDKLGRVKIKTPDDSFNLMLNGWLLYQVISCRIWARTAFYQAGGAFGFRDQLQDSLGLLNICPEMTKNQILLHASRQFIEGDVLHWWHEPSGKGTRTKFSDDLLWLPYVTTKYIRSTGDYEILKEELNFIQDQELKELEDERYSIPKVSNISASLFDHCVRAIEKSLKFGEHGIPLMGSGDWNDGMNMVGNLGKGESVWLGWFLCSVLNQFSLICRDLGKEELSQRYLNISNEIADSIERSAWDGNWYKRAYFDNGKPIGSIQNSECKIDSIAQSWGIISGVANLERALKAMEEVEKYLIDKSEKLIKLFTPPFDKGDLEPGYIKGYLPGIRENGGQYTHAAAWVIIAFAKLGSEDKAFEMFKLINPILHSKTYDECIKYKVEPYVMPADVYSVYPHVGMGGWTWYTGAAAWMYRAGIEYILGFRKEGTIFKINPCIPKDWPEYSIEYKYMDTLYNIKVINKSPSNGVQIIEDGKILDTNEINLKNDLKPHYIEWYY